jgi:hypothetical protein
MVSAFASADVTDIPYGLGKLAPGFQMGAVHKICCVCPGFKQRLG